MKETILKTLAILFVPFAVLAMPALFALLVGVLIMGALGYQLIRISPPPVQTILVIIALMASIWVILGFMASFGLIILPSAIWYQTYKESRERRYEPVMWVNEEGELVRHKPLPSVDRREVLTAVKKGGVR